MVSFLLVCSLLLALVGFGVVALPLFLVVGVIWLVLLPIKFVFGLVFGGLFRILFGLLGGLVSLVLVPLVMVVVGVALVVAFITAVVALLAPLVPVLLLALLGWGIYRSSQYRVSSRGDSRRRPRSSIPFLQRGA